MTTSIWRLAHLILAVFSFLFILMASVTGAILSLEPVIEKSAAYKSSNFNQLTLNQVVPVLKQQYDEILDLSIDENQFVTIQGFDADGNDYTHIINPETGEVLGKPQQQSEFFQWITSLHRSLFLHETGRFIIGFVSFLLFLIAFSGTILIIKRQQSIKNFFNKITKEFFAQYYHVFAGRLLLIPILIISLTGTYLFMLRFEMIPMVASQEASELLVESIEDPMDVQNFPAFKNIKLSEVQKIEFPFMEDPEEFYKIKLTDQEVLISQYSGNIVQTKPIAKAEIFQQFSLDLHTGRTNSIWAIILGIASINIIFFIWSGFVITYKRTKTKLVKNSISVDEAEIVLFVGSENGSTLTFANKIFTQLINQDIKAYIAVFNEYQTFAKAKHFVFFTSTYGMGEAPSNAKKFEKLIANTAQNATVKYTVVGFGSKAYKEFCAFAYKVDALLAQQNWAKPLLPVFTVNDKSPIEFAQWVKAFNEGSRYKLYASPDFYAIEMPKTKPFEVLATSTVFANDTTFTVALQTKQKFKSGDLLAVYPANDYRERLYSIGKVNGQLQLVVKLHEFGLGSQFLYQLQVNQTIKARLVKNANFHFPQTAKQVVLIANGTGIAPFLGMIDENDKAIETHLYAGFRYNNETTAFYQQFMQHNSSLNKLKTVQFAFSREAEKTYVMDLIKKDAVQIASILNNGGVIMICGALAMQRDVELVLEQVCSEQNIQPFATYVANNQFLTDCY